MATIGTAPLEVSGPEVHLAEGDMVSVRFDALLKPGETLALATADMHRARVARHVTAAHLVKGLQVHESSAVVTIFGGVTGWTYRLEVSFKASTGRQWKRYLDVVVDG